MRNNRKFLLSLLLCVMTFASIFCTNILKVEAKSYNVEHAEFNIELQEDGDAIVTETWNLEFDGKYSRFYKEFNTKKIKNIEEFEFELKDVYINGEEAHQLKSKPSDNKRVDNTYYKIGMCLWRIPIFIGHNTG